MKYNLLLGLLSVLLILAACQPASSDENVMRGGEPFELYLVADESLRGPDLAAHDLEDLPLAAEPILRTGDLATYNWEQHTFDLTDEGYQRLQAIFSLGIPMDGLPFVVMAYGERIYAGAFWTPLSSQEFDGVVILLPFDPAAGTFFIFTGYPRTDQFTGEDPRGDERLMHALADAGLVERE